MGNKHGNDWSYDQYKTNHDAQRNERVMAMISRLWCDIMKHIDLELTKLHAPNCLHCVITHCNIVGSTIAVLITVIMLSS
jgi:hypothetical protein